MRCKICGKFQKLSQPHYHVAKELKAKGFPTASPNYFAAHSRASKLEKEKFGAKQYDELTKFDNTLPADELAGKNLLSGKLEVSKKVPAKFRKEVAFHEEVENKILREKIKESKKQKTTKPTHKRKSH